PPVAILLYCSCARRALPSFPTRRSSDLIRFLFIGARFSPCDARPVAWMIVGDMAELVEEYEGNGGIEDALSDVSHIFIRQRVGRDRKSTRLNSSHVKISYAVFCLKKKTN